MVAPLPRDRILRFRLTDNPQPSDVRWEQGKGTIGMCWKLDKAQHTYWLPISERHGRGDLADTAFDKLPDETKMGLTRREFNSIVNKYAEIKAVPLKDSHSRILGVVPVDLALKNRTRADGQALGSRTSRTTSQPLRRSFKRTADTASLEVLIEEGEDMASSSPHDDAQRRNE